MASKAHVSLKMASEYVRRQSKFRKFILGKLSIVSKLTNVIINSTYFFTLRLLR